MHNEAVATDPEKALWQTISMFETIPVLMFCILVVLVVIPCRYGDKLQYNAKKKKDDDRFKTSPKRSVPL